MARRRRRTARPRPRRRIVIACLTLTLAAGLGTLHAQMAPSARAAEPVAVAAAPTTDAFDALDADHDGRLSRQELAASIADFAGPREANRMFDHLDLDHDGLLDHAEYDPDPDAVVAEAPRPAQRKRSTGR